MTWNLTNLTNADVVGTLGQGIAPISTDVTGFHGSDQIILGLLILLFIVAFLAIRRASMEIIGVVLFFAVIALVQLGLLPNVVFLGALFIASIVVVMAYLKYRQR